MNIVFVHLNSKLPGYLKENLENTISMFPNHQVYLVHNGVASIPKLTNLVIFRYVEDSNWEKMESNLSHPRNFRENFWLTSLARFLAIESFAKQFPGEILHLESDVIISKDFPFEKFTRQPKGIAFPIASNRRGVATTVYFRDAEIATKLANFALRIVNEASDTTDMLILRQFFDHFPEITCALPMVPNSEGALSVIPEEPLRTNLSDNLFYFDGLFDGTDIGPYFFGSNPWNARGKSILHLQTPENYSNCKNWLLRCDEEREFLSISTIKDGTRIKAFSVHMLCKDPSIFRNTTRVEIFKKRSLDSFNVQTEKIYFWVLSRMVLSSLRRRLLKLIHKVGIK